MSREDCLLINLCETCWYFYLFVCLFMYVFVFCLFVVVVCLFLFCFRGWGSRMIGGMLFCQNILWGVGCEAQSLYRDK